MAELSETSINVESNNPTSTKPNEEQNFEPNPPNTDKTNMRSSVEKEILQHLLSLNEPEVPPENHKHQETKDMENLDYAQEFPTLMVRVGTQPETEEVFNHQAKTCDVNNGIPNSEDSKAPESSGEGIPTKQSDQENPENYQETEKPNMNLNFAAALANKEVKKKDATRVKVIIHKDQTTLNQQKTVFISRLPVDVTIQQLIFALRQFGPVKVDRITIRRSNQTSGRFCHAFAEFQSSQHASDAVKASKFTIGAAQAYISYKK